MPINERIADHAIRQLTRQGYPSLTKNIYRGYEITLSETRTDSALGWDFNTYDMGEYYIRVFDPEDPWTTLWNGKRNWGGPSHNVRACRQKAIQDARDAIDRHYKTGDFYSHVHFVDIAATVGLLAIVAGIGFGIYRLLT